jgi:hypothetical protein
LASLYALSQPRYEIRSIMVVKLPAPLGKFFRVLLNLGETRSDFVHVFFISQ